MPIALKMPSYDNLLISFNRLRLDSHDHKAWYLFKWHSSSSEI
jgi:hypothetical protein